MDDLVIKADNLTRKFGDFTAVDHISFEVKAGEIFGFLGANGAGKTTAMRMLTGLLVPTDGMATVSGFNVYSDAEQIKKEIGYMSQRFSLYEDLSVQENIRLYGGIYGLSNAEIRNKSARLVELLGLEELKDKRIGSLPLGWKQKLAFSIALIHEPDIVFLDEPTGGVDPITRRQFWEQIYKVADEGTTVFVTTHYMDEAEYCDRVSIMVDGRIDALDTPRGLKQKYDAKNIEEVFIQLARGAQRAE
jgi:ABC-2 type transport system ATP-binding protein